MSKLKFKHENKRREILDELADLNLQVKIIVRDGAGDIGEVKQPLVNIDGILPAIADYILEREDRSNA